MSSSQNQHLLKNGMVLFYWLLINAHLIFFSVSSSKLILNQPTWWIFLMGSMLFLVYFIFRSNSTWLTLLIFSIVFAVFQLWLYLFTDLLINFHRDYSLEPFWSMQTIGEIMLEFSSVIGFVALILYSKPKH